jgi:hypothetical protein
MRKLKSISLLVPVICFVWIGCAFGSGVNRTDHIKETTGKVKEPIMMTSSIEWEKCKNKEIPSNHQVSWKVRIDEISTFGGLYGKAHLVENGLCKVRLRWSTESDFYQNRLPEIKDGDTVQVTGTFWGVSEDGTVIVDVKHFEILDFKQ